MLGKIRNRINSWRLNVKSYNRKKQIQKDLDEKKIEHLKKTISCKYKWYGNSYGGFFIIPELLNNSSIVYSFGIGKDLSFDEMVIKNHHCKVYGFDPTPKSINWIKEQKLPNTFYFHDYGISDSDTRYVDFFLPKNPKGVSGSIVNHVDTNKENYVKVLIKSFDDIAKELNHNHIDVVKMDIEGIEYEVLNSLLKSSVTIDQLLVEFHDRLFDKQEFKSKEIVQKLKEHGYEVFGSSISYEEISFVHKRKINKLNIL